MNTTTAVAPVITASNDSLRRDFPLRPFAIRHKLAGHPLVAPWPWLLAALALAVVFWRRRARDPRAWLGLALVGSAWAYALPLAVLAASAELRYLAPGLALVALAGMLALAPPGARRARP